MHKSLLYDPRSYRSSEQIGGKAEGLRFLLRRGFRVPTTYVCTWEAYLRHLAKDPGIDSSLRSILQEKLNPERTYAVRSSTNVEDGLQHSFAGQFKTVLGVQGVDAVLQAIQEIWSSARSAEAMVYLHRVGIDPGDVKVAVIVQEMVRPVVSGVSFSKHPMTGMDEVVVEAVTGSGEALVQEGLTPLRWVDKWGRWLVKADTEEIVLDLIQDVVQQTKEIARAYGQPVDLEWVYDGHSLYWVQLRGITSLRGVNVYSNQISKEFFPGLVKPLVWSVNVPLVNGAWIRLFTELIGPNDIDPNSLAKSFYYRAYFNMGAVGDILELLGLPRETIELLLGIEAEGPEKPSFRPTPKTYGLLPRLLRFAAGKVRFAGKLEAFMPAMEDRLESLPTDRVGHLTDAQLLQEIDRLYAWTQEAAYYDIATRLLLGAYTRALRAQLANVGLDLEHVDMNEGMEELDRYQPHVHLARLHEQFQGLDDDLKARVRTSNYEEFCRLPGIQPLQVGVSQFIELFGHLSDSGNDFSQIPWRENPDLILKMVANYVPSGSGSEQEPGLADLKMRPQRQLLLDLVYKRARRFRWYREAVSSLYTYGYGLFRVYFSALGDRLVEKDVIETPEDLYYLYFDQVRGAVEGGGQPTGYMADVRRRKREMEECQGVTPPAIIYGEDAPPVEASASSKLRGTPTSRGTHRGPARVVQGIRDFDKVQEGDVLVVPYSDVGWTPLFARAGAVIAESGGILSHSSIVAREYGIPAVVSVPGACQLVDDTLVTVDGYRGEILIHQTLDAQEER